MVVKKRLFYFEMRIVQTESSVNNFNKPGGERVEVPYPQTSFVGSRHRRAIKNKSMRTDKQKTTVKRPDVRSLKIQPKIRVNRYSNKSVPEIKLCGDWLRNAGFDINERVLVTTMPYLLIIRATE